MEPRKAFYQTQAEQIIKKLEKRYMEGYYVSTKEEAVDLVKDIIKEGSSISWGGSMTIHDSGIVPALKERNYEIHDRSQATTPEGIRSTYLKAMDCDYFLMSTNAITLDGQLINIDGNGNRVAALIYGPHNVLVIAGMNKVTTDVEAGIKRVVNHASPINTQRLNKKTPCNKTGSCHQCLCDDTICCNTVITRKSHHRGRIKVILVGEELGY